MRFASTAAGVLVRVPETGRTERSARDGAKRLASATFDRALHHAGTSSKGIAPVLGVSPTRVRALRDPDELGATPNLADAILLPESDYAALELELRAERLQLHGAPLAPATTAERLVRVLQVFAQVVSVLAGTPAIVDGRRVGHELRGAIRVAEIALATLPNKDGDR